MFMITFLNIQILTHLPYRVNGKKRDISNNNSVLKAPGKSTLADFFCYCKVMSVMALDSVTSFSCLKEVTNTSKRMRHSPTIGGNSSVHWCEVERS